MPEHRLQKTREAYEPSIDERIKSLCKWADEQDARTGGLAGTIAAIELVKRLTKCHGA